MPFLRGAILVLSCCKEKYEKLRLECWEKALSKIASKMPIFYLFGKSDNEGKIPNHPNVYKIVANCLDNYEDIPLKMYDGYRLLSVLDYDYIIKLDDNVTINDIWKLLTIVDEEILEHDYIALKGIGHPKAKGISKEDAQSNLQFSYFHTMSVSDKRFAFTPSIRYITPFAGGSAYALSKKAYTLLTKDVFIKSLLEDNAIGFKLFINDIHVYKSKAIDEKLIEDIDLHSYPQEYLDFVINSSKHMNYFQKQAEDLSVKQPCIVHVIGGLGNQLFTIATGLAYCYKHDLVLQLYPTPNFRNYYWNSILSPFKKYVIEKDDTTLQTYREPTFAFKEIPIGKQRLAGYFQSSKYFKNIQSIMKNCIVFPDPERMSKLLIDNYGIITSQHVIVHARRGDYLKFAEVHNPLPDKYYEDGLIEIKKRIANPTFVLLSDDKDYWKNSNVFKKENYVIVNEDEITTLFLMTICKHFIMANSPFSWWGVYFANAETVITPKDWFGPKGYPDWQDIYEEKWIKI